MDSSAESASAAQTPVTPVSFAQSVANDPEGALNTFQQIQNQNAAMAAQIASLTAQVAAITTPSSSAPSTTDEPPPPSTSAPASVPSAKTASSSAPVPVVATVPLSAGEPMDLDAAMAAVKGRSLDFPGVRDICNKWQLCYYCKESHKGKTAKDCPNKKKSSNLRIVDLDDTASIDGGVPVPPGKA